MYLASLLATLLPLFALVQSSPTYRRSISPCLNLKLPAIPNVRFLSIQWTERQNFTIAAAPPLLAVDVPNLSVCEALVTATHPGVNDKVNILVWMPLDGWNGRFVASGGSAWAAGLGNYSLAPVVAQGYATATTDAGLSGDPLTPATWALNESGQVNLDLLTNFASRSIHEMAVVGKAAISAYYGHPAKYAYWSGCSTGGRQGMVAAQQYPGDFDGIAAGAPAIFWPEYVVAEQWPQVVMKEEGYLPLKCELDVVTSAAISACDQLDGVKDGVVSDLSKCKFDPFTVVGSRANCSGSEVTISPIVAKIVQRVWEGPKTESGRPLWFGSTLPAPLSTLAEVDVVNGSRVGKPFLVNDAWIRYFVEANPNYDLSKIDTAELTKIFQSSSRYDKIIGSANPDLSGLQKSGAKLLVWHGLADQLIYPQGTIKYRREVEKVLGHSSKVDNFFRLFLAPGVDHCGAGTTPGAIPTDPLAALISWVEKGVAPDVLPAAATTASGGQITRNICRYPLVSKYKGNGDPVVASSYDCVANR